MNKIKQNQTDQVTSGESPRRLIITKDKDDFTESECVCKVCQSMNDVDEEWDSFTPQTNLQKRMKDVIARIETREKKKRKI